MANKVPLTINTTSSTIEELPSGDNLDLSGSNISSVGNITSTGTLTVNTVSANSISVASTGNINGGNLVTANWISGTLTTAAQPNITSTGILGSLTVSGVSTLGNIGNVKITGGSNNQVVVTDGSGNLSFASVSSDSYQLQPVRVATIAPITLSGLQTIDGVTLIAGDRVLVWLQNANPLTGSVDNGIYIVSSGSWTRATDFTTGSNTLVGGVTVTARAGTQLGGVTFVCTNTTAITISSTVITFIQASNTGLISIWNQGSGFLNKATSQGGGTAMGVVATATVDGTAIGYIANAQNSGVALGYNAVANTQGVALGRDARAGVNGVSVGYPAGQLTPGANTTIVGYFAGYNTAGANSVAIGMNAGRTNLGANSIAIGTNAGYTNQAANSIVINATGANLDNTTGNSLVVKPVRAVTDVTGFKQLYYNPTTGEIVYYNI